MSFSFHFCHVWLKISCFSTSRLFYSTSVLYLSTSVVFCFFCLIQFPSWFSTSLIIYVLLPPPPTNSLVFSYIAVHSTSQGNHVALPEDFKKSYTNGVISMWNPFTNAFPLASQSYSLNVKVVIYVPPFVSIFSTLLHGCCCFY